MKKALLTLFACAFCLQGGAAEPRADLFEKRLSMKGGCSIAFPSQPEHMQQMMPLPQENTSLRYDVYVAGIPDESVFMVLIAEYPTLVGDQYAELSLEGFLNGILSQNPQNKLVFADLLEVQGHKALDFFIKTGDVYFKGRAILAHNSLYLLAMECESVNYVEENYDLFITSFKLER